MIQTLQAAQNEGGDPHSRPTANGGPANGAPGLGAPRRTAEGASAESPRIESTAVLWGLSALQLHDAYWRSKGVQCVRRGQRVPLDRAAEVYLLLEPGQLVLFNISEMSERLTWHNAVVTRLRLVDESRKVKMSKGESVSPLDVSTFAFGGHYAEHVVVDERGLVQRIERRYRAAVRGSSRVMLARSRRVASIWMWTGAPRSRREGWDRVRRAVPWSRVDHWKCVGRTFIAGDAAQQAQMIDDLVERWPYPNQSILNVQESSPGVWHPIGETIAPGVVRIGPLWLGHGGGGSEHRCIVGPAWMGDRPANGQEAGTGRVRRSAALKDIADVELPEVATEETVDIGPSGAYHAVKRALDIFASATALLVLFPVMAAVGLAVWMESGSPLFFGHDRQGRGGRVFKCWKFRTMHKRALEMVPMFAEQNQCDGPQVNIRNDPRVTRVGKILRKCHLDELPQFWNVLCGNMSLVGPRPSPDKENQYCPAWRDLRLSVRPGITGLWQLKRKREPGEDFQEWIKYDIEYVQRASLWFDLVILVRTAVMLLRGRVSRAPE